MGNRLEWDKPMKVIIGRKVIIEFSCPYCKAILEKKSVFCGNCAVRLDWGEEEKKKRERRK